MREAKPGKSAMMALIWAMLALIVLTGASYAWFTFTSSATVQPMQGRISEDGINLYISNNKDGPFDISCTLIINNDTDRLTPISTENLSEWKVPQRQDKIGKVLAYRDVTDRVDEYSFHGTVYLTNLENNCTFELDADGTSFGENALALSAMRIGFRVTTAQGTSTYIYATDESAWQGAVLGRIDEGEIATVEFWLWLEGEDPECGNEVQSKDVALQLQFKGTEIK
jgi:hypothetical protein